MSKNRKSHLKTLPTTAWIAPPGAPLPARPTPTTVRHPPNSRAAADSRNKTTAAPVAEASEAALEEGSAAATAVVDMEAVVDSEVVSEEDSPAEALEEDIRDLGALAEANTAVE